MKEKEKNDQSTEVKTIKRLNKRANELIKVMYYNGATYEEIGKKIGCSRQAVSRYLQQLGLNKRRRLNLYRENVELFKRLFFQGCTFEEIAEYMAITRQTASIYAQELHLKRSPIGPNTRETIEKVKNLIAQGLPKSKIMKELGINELTYENIKKMIEAINPRNSPIIQDIKKFIHLGYSDKEIANILKVSVSRVRYWIKKENYNITPQEDLNITKDMTPDNLNKMLYTGMSYDDIASFWECDIADVHNMEKYWVKRNMEEAEENIQKIKNFVAHLKENGATPPDIADTTGLSIEAVRLLIEEIEKEI